MSVFRDELLAFIPNLRAFALSLLAGDPCRADDLVQETLLRAIKYEHQFEPGTNFHAWLMTILRNVFYTTHRRTKREVEDSEGLHAGKFASGPTQIDACELRECLEALAKLPAEQREALILVVMEDVDYEQAAEICGCAVGTMKSRVNRARNALAALTHRNRISGDPLEPSEEVAAPQSRSRRRESGAAQNPALAA